MGSILSARRLDRAGKFPELKQKAREFYEQHRPDSLIIESRATGRLIRELRKAGLYVDEMPAHRGHDKHTKTNAVADMFSSGAIWSPLSRRWAQEVVEEMAAFPYGDAAVLGLLRLRRGGFRIATDKEEEEWRPRAAREYYRDPSQAAIPTTLGSCCSGSSSS